MSDRGDTVNTASRMESSGLPGCIQVTEATWLRVRERYSSQVREGVEVKGKGPMTTYLLDPDGRLQMRERQIVVAGGAVVLLAVVALGWGFASGAFDRSWRRG